MVKIERTTRQRFVTAKHVGDIVIPAKSVSSILNVDVVPVLIKEPGNSKQLMFIAGFSDELWGTDPWLEGARKKPLDNTGHRKETTRQKPRFIHIDLLDAETDNI
jgi:hypothetical protein